jgi:hypothetical protein
VKYSRAAIAVLTIALWVSGMAMMFRRNANRSEAQRLDPKRDFR